MGRIRSSFEKLEKEELMNAITVCVLHKSFSDLEALKGVDLAIREGEFYALMGPNGSGKTTLASIIASVRSPTSGSVEIYGKEPKKAKKFIGYVPQENFSSPMLTGRENLMYFAGLLGYPKTEAKSIVDELLSKIGLSQEADKMVSHYSGGMRKRLEVATALFPGIKILILDEPTTGLDPSARRRFLGLIRDVKGEETTILLVTHIGADAESASRVGLMDNGEIIAEDTPERLKQASGLTNVMEVETTFRSNRIADLLSDFSDKKRVLETDRGYRIYCEDADKATPDIVRSLDAIGCKAIRIEITKPSLEDVFFKLTEKAVTEVA
jgi:ABC-2 type transport system ATP-binding protein